ncbi:MAG TPA: L,D-transpeptidase [Phycisphaerae bacterium]|nr:L,D-transpeptidase [Phycisphaerae bacterium]HNU46403.1 L,D-transpeptidase [Phycisphaerae bacterium]
MPLRAPVAFSECVSEADRLNLRLFCYDHRDRVRRLPGGGIRHRGITRVFREALGQERYGVHGTIDPDSIGRNASHGCIRMFNEDVEFLYDLLVVKHSTVTVK